MQKSELYLTKSLAHFYIVFSMPGRQEKLIITSKHSIKDAPHPHPVFLLCPRPCATESAGSLCPSRTSLCFSSMPKAKLPGLSWPDLHPQPFQRGSQEPTPRQEREPAGIGSSSTPHTQQVRLVSEEASRPRGQTTSGPRQADTSHWFILWQAVV